MKTWTVKAFAKTQAGSKIKLTRKGVSGFDVSETMKGFREIIEGVPGEAVTGITFEVSSHGEGK